MYIPLGGNRTGNVYLHLLTVFFLTGLWHGASWNFVVWGLWHGMFLIVERLARNRSTTVSLPSAVKWFYTMLVVVIGWVFFRAENLSAAVSYLQSMFGLNSIAGQMTMYALQDYGVTFILGIICMLPILHKYKVWREKSDLHQRASYILEPLLCGILLLLGIAFTVSSAYNPFIYFNF